MFTAVFMVLFVVICFLNNSVFLMTCCICAAFGALCFVWEAQEDDDDKCFLLAVLVAAAALGLLFYVSTSVHTDATIRNKIQDGFPAAKRAYEFCRTIVENAEGWAAEEGVDIKFVKQTPWSKFFK